MEYWSVGVMEKELLTFRLSVSNTPILHHSCLYITPLIDNFYLLFYEPVKFLAIK
jgi:hypothetical protein